ncbi:hypothetical protein [Bradyrhizobium liaoningense]|uniref:hypothetical protein n=1 Tax=Bradyrhizobium liaoningense TaxID=43992 RepID=UPI001BA492F8|nr:hypothetical protein [Bradyrhizobium liaoningense]MBR0705398.1 hypothetical protein [Bradyrhizobium liaoningense]
MIAAMVPEGMTLLNHQNRRNQQKDVVHQHQFHRETYGMQDGEPHGFDGSCGSVGSREIERRK